MRADASLQGLHLSAKGVLGRMCMCRFLFGSVIQGGSSDWGVQCHVVWLRVWPVASGWPAWVVCRGVCMLTSCRARRITRGSSSRGGGRSSAQGRGRAMPADSAKAPGKGGGPRAAPAEGPPAQKALPPRPAAAQSAAAAKSGGAAAAAPKSPPLPEGDASFAEYAARWYAARGMQAAWVGGATSRHMLGNFVHTTGGSGLQSAWRDHRRHSAPNR